MNIENQLEKLKKMHDDGLLTDDVYNEKQKEVLSSNTKAPGSKFWDIRRNISILAKLAIIIGIFLGAFYFYYQMSDKGTKEAINKVVGNTVVGKSVISWEDRAESVTKRIININRNKLAYAIQKITHPTGKQPSLERADISKLNGRIQTELLVTWHGAFSGRKYSTAVVWSFNKTEHQSAEISFDNSTTGVSSNNKARLNDYFRTKVFPTIYNSLR